MSDAYLPMSGPVTGLNAATANGSSAAIPIPRGEWETSVWVATTGGPTAGTVAIDVSNDGGTTWAAAAVTTPTVSATATVRVVASVVVPAGTTHIRHTLAALAGGTAPTVTSQAFFRKRD